MAPAATRDASDLFLRAYLQIQEGDAAAEKNDWNTAQTRYQDALIILKDIEAVQPDWNPHIISFRKRYCDEHIATMKAKIAAAASPTPPQTSPAATTPAAPADASSEVNRLRDLSIALDRLRQEVQRLQAERVATTVAPPAESETVRRLQTELADARRQNEQLMADKIRIIPASEQAQQAKDEMARLQTERAELLRQLREKDQKLAANEKMAVSANTLEALRNENQQLSRKLTAAEADASRNAEKVVAFSSTASELSVARGQIDKLRDDLAKTQGKDKDVAKLQKANADLTAELTKAQALLAMNKAAPAPRAGEDAAEVAKLRQQLAEVTAKLSATDTRAADLQHQAQDALAQLASLRSQLAQRKNQPADADKQMLTKENALLQVALDKKNADLRELSNRTASGGGYSVLMRQLRAQLREANDRLAARDRARETLEKENSVLKIAFEKKAQEYDKLAGDRNADRARIAEVEKALNDLQKHLTVIDSNNRRLTPEEEAFLKKTEVVIHPPQDESMSGEISANLLRAAKERALAEVTERYRKTVPRAPAPTLAQADIGSDKTTASDATNAVARPQQSAPGTSNIEPARPPIAKLPPELKKLVDEARELYNEKKLDEAAAKYREVLKRDPDNLYGLSNLAVIRFQQDRLDEAERLLNRALTIAPDDAYSHSIIGIIYYKQNRLDEAIEELSRSVKLNPDNSEAHNYLGIACWQKGWKSAAEQALRKAIETKPDYADAHFNLAVIYATQKPPFIGLAKFHYRKTLDLGRQRDAALEKIFAGETK